ncbi:MAG: hypothetical protein ABIQ32_11340 [Sphingomicrobium sp.]
MNKTWNVLVDGHHVGTVHEQNEGLARCAALSRFGVADDEFAAMGPREQNDVRNFGIPPDAEFVVLPA